MKSSVNKVVASLLLAGGVCIGVVHSVAAQNEAPKHLAPAAKMSPVADTERPATANPANVSWPYPMLAPST